MKKKNCHVKVSGFTIVELLVVITVMALLFAIGYGSFRDFSRRQALVSVARQIEGDMRLAQELASSGKKPESCATKTLNAYGFEVKSNNTYDIYAECNPATSNDDKYYKKGVTVPAGISLSTDGSVKISFYTVTGYNNAGDGYRVFIAQDGTGITTSVLANKGGDIIIENLVTPGPPTPAPDPTPSPPPPGSPHPHTTLPPWWGGGHLPPHAEY